MKLLIALCLVAVVAAAPPVYNYPQGNVQRNAPPVYNYPQGNVQRNAPPVYNYPQGNVQITRYINDNLGNNGYRYEWEQTDGQKAQQVGQLKNEGREDESLAVTGSFSWVDPNGVTYTVTYKADENGYQPEIEQGPGGGVPPAVVASLLG